ncbi:hypothetical protein M422DRAFT_25604 [Sphaerobolus stellatus SS14]|nr:hypothetical protein M422DRAFT_25604 [Sphaerobolus stellatus SS14]
MHMVLSHLPIGHVYSDLDTVEELLKAAQDYLHGMRYLVEAERRARIHIETQIMLGRI